MGKNKNKGDNSESIKKRLLILFNLNKKRKSTLDKISKSILDGPEEREDITDINH